jgi:hypothetical protein
MITFDCTRRHSGLGPESMNTVRGETHTAMFMDPGFRRDDGKAEST